MGSCLIFFKKNEDKRERMFFNLSALLREISLERDTRSNNYLGWLEKKAAQVKQTTQENMMNSDAFAANFL